MCGIFGYIGSQNVKQILLEGLKTLEYRGYDSTGIAILDTDITLKKCVGSVSELDLTISNLDLPGKLGIAHTRWATHGKVTKKNSHPHISVNKEIAITHNGIIDNHKYLRNMLESEGVIFESETDSEIIVHLIAKYYNQGKTPLDSVKSALILINGTWGICVIFKNHDLIICARNGSPMVSGRGEHGSFISSDPHSISKYTNEMIFLEDGDIAILKDDGIEVDSLNGHSSKVVKFEDTWEITELGDFEHHMIKEISEQPESLERCLSGRIIIDKGFCRLRGLELSERELSNKINIHLIGCGTAFHASEMGAMAIEEISGISAKASVGSEFLINNPIIKMDTIYIAVSQSGETSDVLDVVKKIKNAGGLIMGVINVVGSTIARECERGAYMHAGSEISVASTKVCTNMIAILLMFGIQIGRANNLSEKDSKNILQELNILPNKIRDYLNDPGDVLAAVELIKDSKLVFFMGRGVSSIVAKEGALKLMEVAYIPCLSYPSGEMKHGPLALIEEGVPVVVILPKNKSRERVISNIEECRTRGAKIIIIHEEDDNEIIEYADVSIPIPQTGKYISPIMSNIPLQLIAYHTALSLNINPDKPRNLAKSVTVH